MKTEVAQMRIARDVKDAERALNDALIAQANLFSTMLISRRETGAEPFIGHAELLRLAKSQQALLASSGDLARVHGGLQEIQQEVAGFRECPPNEPMGFSDENVGQVA